LASAFHFKQVRPALKKDNMRQIIAFWNKDIVTKLIILITFLLVLGVATLVILVMRMPAGKSLQGAIAEYFPTPTSEPRVVMTNAAQIAATRFAEASASVPVTITTMPFTPVVPSKTSKPLKPGQITATEPPPTATRSLPSATPKQLSSSPIPIKIPATATRVAFQPTPTITPQKTATPERLACIPANPPQKGKVLSVLDGNTIKVLINGFAYNVRYIGIQPPSNKNFAILASNTNGDLVFAEEVTLIPDVQDKDEKGFLLRYVQVGNMAPSIELLKKGLASAVDSTPNSACNQAFKDAEQVARALKIGIWIPTPSSLP
jgi:endonuclease YncB( thermonuclease family)